MSNLMENYPFVVRDVALLTLFSMAVVNSVCGIGILTTPYTVKEAGWATLVLLVLFSVICYYTGVLLKHCFESERGILSYPDIGDAALGNMDAFSYLSYDGLNWISPQYTYESKLLTGGS